VFLLERYSGVTPPTPEFLSGNSWISFSSCEQACPPNQIVGNLMFWVIYLHVDLHYCTILYIHNEMLSFHWSHLNQSRAIQTGPLINRHNCCSYWFTRRFIPNPLIRPSSLPVGKKMKKERAFLFFCVIERSFLFSGETRGLLLVSRYQNPTTVLSVAFSVMSKAHYIVIISYNGSKHQQQQHPSCSIL